MDSARLRFKVWCEDRRHEAFARRVLEAEFGASSRQLEFVIAPSGRGAASHWVMKQANAIAEEARATRGQSGRVLVVILDGDNVGHEETGRQLALALGHMPNDKVILRWFPTWSIETWVVALTGTPVIAEDQKYKTLITDRDYYERARKAARAWRGFHSPTLPALNDARQQLDELAS